jgi:hypothetical protein
MTGPPPALACDLGALTPAEQTRRSTVASRVTARFREVQETPTGYAAALGPDPAVLQDGLDWVLLERRCCPFLRLDLCFEPSNGPIWLRFEGGAGVKEFLAAVGFRVVPRPLTG